MPLFNVPRGLVRILDRDLAAAGIAKRDDRGRTIDVHAMRHTFASHLVAAGVAPRIAQAAMRHSDIRLTMGVYTDPRLLDVHGVQRKARITDGVLQWLGDDLHPVDQVMLGEGQKLVSFLPVPGEAKQAWALDKARMVGDVWAFKV